MKLKRSKIKVRERERERYLESAKILYYILFVLFSIYMVDLHTGFGIG